MSVRIDYTKVAPAGVKALGGVYGYILQSGLSDVLVELVYLRITAVEPPSMKDERVGPGGAAAKPV